jgi:hypothetical protein
VDHFIAWSRYPVDLAQPFVLAHDRCNSTKADHIAAYEHLHAWVERNVQYSLDLAREFNRKEILHDLPTTVHIAEWAYSQTQSAGGLTWLRNDELVPLSEEWRVDLEKLKSVVPASPTRV